MKSNVKKNRKQKSKVYKRIIFLTIAILMALAGESAQAAEFHLKMGSLAPENSSWADLLMDIKRSIESGSKGRMKVTLFLGGAQGDEPDMVRKMRIGQLQSGAFTLNGLNRVAPELAVIELPFLFEDISELDYVRKKMHSKFDTYFLKNGFKLADLVDQAPHVHFYSVEEPIRTPKDLARQKMWVWADERMGIETYKALGISPVSLGTPEVITSLQTGLINGLYGGPYALMALQWHTYVKYVTLINLRYEPGAIVFTSKFWDSIPPDLQEIVMGSVNVMSPKEIEISRRDEVESLKLLEEQGKKIVTLTPEEREEFKRLTRPVWDNLAGNMYPKELLDEILASINEFRGRKQLTGQDFNLLVR